MLRKLKKCKECEEYTLRQKCPRCETNTSDPIPARYSPEDRYGKYRRMLKREIRETGNS